MFYTPERTIYKNEQGIFALDIWQDDGKTNVYAIQIDSKNSVHGFSFNISRIEAINEAVNYVVENNK